MIGSPPIPTTVDCPIPAWERWWAENGTKPLVAYIAGFSAPPGKRMGHAGAIVTGGDDTAQAKADRLEKAEIPVARTPTEVARLVQEALR